ncbi:hypothetical protein DNTS_016654 [Danionella cerebrum]|uniref:Ubiquitin carboxyl-terminal hydrolase MINDY n=1 Tax=Danionella cerebrum TaxID=2873325 RepID=A0A553Q0D0_9TELE|nr:hypothetical protein DNTS_016654 [Danionella translucida]
MMTNLEDILQTIKSLQQSRPSYIELLQAEVKRNPDRAAENLKSKEDAEETSRLGTSSLHPTAQTLLLTVPFSVPPALAVSASLGGLPLSPELAASLRNILFGNMFHIFNYEWKKSFFKFREPFSDLSYALETERGGAGAIQMVVQTQIIDHLLFKRSIDSEAVMESLVDIGEHEQRGALAAALTSILWRAGEEQTATVCLVTTRRCFTPQLHYKLDSFTERLQLFSFKKKEDVRVFIHEHIQCFREEGSHGVILFLYSLIFSRSLDRIWTDLDWTTTHLLQPSFGSFVCRQALMNLLLTGRATPHVFNGTSHDNEQDKPLHGVRTRSEVGYLLWNREKFNHTQVPSVGSMLKTPKLPIWVCHINGTYSVLFSTNCSLLSDWKMEHLFQLYFYNGQLSQLRTSTLTIDTHSHHWEVENKDVQGDPEKKFPSLEMTIRTKWEGAVIDWNGMVPFF